MSEALQAVVIPSLPNREMDYPGLVGELASLESLPDKKKLRPVYDQLLSKYPCLEGFWVRWAHTEFRIEGANAALNIFHRALDTPILQQSLILWTDYLRFKLRICPDNNLLAEFEKAAGLVGTQFLSHEFWDLYLEVCETPVDLLIKILDERTLHQFARFYAQLLELLPQKLEDFQRVLGLSTESNAEEEALVRKVIESKLHLKYELHSRRVDQIWPLVKPIKRPFFHPKKCPDGTHWLAYAKASGSTETIFRQAIIPCFLDPSVWLGYIRFKIRTNSSDDEIREIYEMGCHTRPVLLHFALWLEYKGDIPGAKELYRNEKDGQKLQFLARIGEAPQTATFPSTSAKPKAPALADQSMDNELYTDEEL